MKRVLDFVVRRPLLVLALLALPSAAALLALVDPESGRLRLRIDPSVERLLPEHDEGRRFWRKSRQVFGEGPSVVVALPTDGVFTRENLERVERMTRSLEELPGVRRVLSLANAPLLLDDDGVTLMSRLPAQLREEGGLERIRAAVRGNPLYRGVLVSPDEKVAAVVVELGNLSDAEFLERDTATRIREAVAAEAGSAGVWITGEPVVKAATSRLLLKELRWVVPGTLLVGGLILFAAFGSALAVVLPLATVLLACLWTLGSLAWRGHALNLVTVSVPPLVIAIGLAYAMHVLSECLPAAGAVGARGEAVRERVREGMRRVALPLAVAGLTTLGGLLGLVASPLQAIREFGWLAILGLAYTLLIVCTLVPAGLCLAPSVRGLRAPPASALVERLAGRLADFDLRHRRSLLAATGVLVALGVAGATRVQVGARSVSDLPADSRVRRDHEAIAAAFGGATPLSVVIETNLPDAFTDPGLLAEVEALQRWLQSQPEVAATASLVDHVEVLQRAMGGGGERLALPDSQALTKQLLVLAGGREIRSYADLRFHTTRISVRANVESSAAMAALLDRVEERLASLPPLFQARVTGGAVLLSRAVDRVARGQVAGVALALALIYAILAVLFTSLRAGLIALLPNAAVVAIYFGVLGFSGLSLDPSSSLIACIALGIAVDDTIHFMVRFRDEARRHASEELAMSRTLRAVARPITFTTLVLCSGFLMLTASDLRNQVQFGGLAAFALAAAWVLDVTLTPALCAGMRLVTFWDVLRVDLGPEPQRSIPLMHGLSPREARTVALILDFREVGAGEAVVRQGEPLDEVYVVIEGELEVWSEREGRRVDLYRAVRGDVVGETSFFSSASPANVVAASDARLLRFEDSDLEYLVAHHPRIAAHVYRNLNHAQAKRIFGVGLPGG